MIYLVQFYDDNESGNVEHNEIYTTRKAAQRRYDNLANNLNGYSWVYLFDTYSTFGRIKSNKCLARCSSCNGKDDYYHGDNSDF